MARITVVNNSNTRLLFSDFKAGDAKIPLDTAWIDAYSTGHLNAGNFESLGVGVQVQNGGNWLGGEPQNEPYVKPEGTFTFTMKREAFQVKQATA